jgi:hypothetical protein
MVLLLAMAFATATGFLAWGSVPITAAGPHRATEAVGTGVLGVLDTFAAVPLFIAGALGLLALQRSAWPAYLRGPAPGFFALCIALSITHLFHRQHASDAGVLLTHLLSAAALSALTLTFLAERVDALFGRPSMLAVAAGAVAIAALWCWASGRGEMDGDLRPLLFLQSLPLLLLPSGALSLPGRCTARADWLGILGLCLLARIAGLADEELHAATGSLSGHALSHLGCAGMAGWLAYRAVVAPVDERALTPALANPTQRSTSLNTSS